MLSFLAMLLGFPLFGWGVLRWLFGMPQPGESVNVTWSERKRRELDQNGIQAVIYAIAIGGGLILYAIAEIWT